MITLALKIVLALEAGWFVVLLALLGFTMAVLSASRRHRLAALVAGPAIQDAVALHLSGSNDLTELRGLAKAHPEAVQSSILAFQGMVGGTDRLAELALSLGFVEQWCEASHSSRVSERRRAFSRIAALSRAEPVRRMTGTIPAAGLQDVDDQVRLDASRALVCSEEPAQVARVFEAVLRDAPLNRALLAPMLRRHAAELCHTTIPRALTTLGAVDLVNLLRLLASWECSLPLVDVSPLAGHPMLEVRVETMRLLARVPINAMNRGAILRGLSDPDLAVLTAAVESVGRLKLPEAIPQVTACLRRHDAGLAQAAAAVLADLGPEGRGALEGQLGNPDPIAAKAARQALEMAAGVAA
jgi:hypothetical protein